MAIFALLGLLTLLSIYMAMMNREAREENRQILKNHYEWCKDNGYDTKWYKERKGENGRTRI